MNRVIELEDENKQLKIDLLLTRIQAIDATNALNNVLRAQFISQLKELGWSNANVRTDQ